MYGFGSIVVMVSTIFTWLQGMSGRSRCDRNCGSRPIVQYRGDLYGPDSTQTARFVHRLQSPRVVWFKVAVWIIRDDKTSLVRLFSVDRKNGSKIECISWSRVEKKLVFPKQV